MHEIDTPEPERDGFTHVSDNDLEVGKPVENATDDQPDRVGTRLDTISPHGALDSIAAKRIRHAIRRSARMNVERTLQMLGGLKNRPESRIIKILAVCVRIHDESLESERVDGSIHLVRRTFRRMRSKTRETGKT